MTTSTCATLDVLTLDTWGLRWPLARDRRRRFQRIADHLRETPYDVVTLHELWTRGAETLGDTGLAMSDHEAVAARLGITG